MTMGVAVEVLKQSISAEVLILSMNFNLKFERVLTLRAKAKSC